MVSPTAAIVTVVEEARAPARWTRPDAPTGATPDPPRAIAGTTNVTIGMIQTLRTVAESIRRVPANRSKPRGYMLRRWSDSTLEVRDGVGSTGYRSGGPQRSDPRDHSHRGRHDRAGLRMGRSRPQELR